MTDSLPDGCHALIVGASGLTGSALLRLLLDAPNVARVTALVRRRLPVDHPKLEQVELDFAELEQRRELIRADIVYCCLGTTIGKAGSEARFKTVDYFYPLTLAMLAKMNGVPSFAAISSLGANADSPTFYLKTKGQLENALKALAFDQLLLVRPSLLTGERQEFRLAERLSLAAGRLVSPLLLGWLRRYRPIAAEVVAWNLLQATRDVGHGTNIIESEQLAARYASRR